MSRFIATAGKLLRLTSGFCLTAVALRFASASVERALRVHNAPDRGVVYTDAAPFLSGKAAKPGAVPLASALGLGANAALAPSELQQLGLAPATAAGPLGAEPAGSARAPAALPLVRMELVVSAGPARSEVFINGSRKGHTPFIGELNCRLNDAVRVEIVPPRGMPLTFKRTCEQGTLSLR